MKLFQIIILKLRITDVLKLAQLVNSKISENFEFILRKNEVKGAGVILF